MEASRRSILRYGVLALGAVAGVVGLTGAAEKIRAGTLSASSLEVSGTDWHLTGIGLQRGEMPKRGDVVTVTGVVSVGEESGTFRAVVQHLATPDGHGPYATVQQETHTFLLPGGAIFGMGSAAPGADGVYAIVGGTGRYSGASGSYLGRQRPFETGGDGTALFTLNLNPGR